MTRTSREIGIALVLLIGLPLVGVWLAGKPVGQYLEFPPHTIYVQHEPFSWPVFITFAILILLSVGPIVLRLLSALSRSTILTSRQTSPVHEHVALKSRWSILPWWGWIGIGWTCSWWVLAWTRFSWMTSLQEHTFTPLWLGYIVIVNALTFARTGHCLLLHRPKYFLSLFPLSAAFWWFFEYLNRFVQNWYYVGVTELSAMEYVLRATVSFSTVLPAVISTAELLTSVPFLSMTLERMRPIRLHDGRFLSCALLVLSCGSLLTIGIWPNYLFPLVWVAPLLVIVTLQALNGRPTIVAPLIHGDWRGIWLPAFAALICGLFWELWNFRSLAHWEYALPFVYQLRLFEMPLLGYAGYLPFGLECLVVADFCLERKFSGGLDYYRTHAYVNAHRVS